MRALLSFEPGGGSTLRVGTLPVPEPGPGEIRIESRFAGINFPDTLIIVDRYQISPVRPFAPGIEVAGVVDAVGPGVAWAQVGQPVVALVRYGALAEYVVASEPSVALLPSETDLAMGASLVVSHGTSWHALHDRANLQSGETLLVLGASGIVGMAAVQIGKALGARVIAAVSSPDKARAVRSNGADDVLIYPRDGVDGRALAASLKEACGEGGAGCVFDPVGGAYGEAAFRALGWQGRYLTVGFAAALPMLPANLVLLKSADVLGVSWGETVFRTPGLFQCHMTQIGGLIARGAIAPGRPNIVPLEEAGAAISSLAARAAVGKTVVQVRAGSPRHAGN